MHVAVERPWTHAASSHAFTAAPQQARRRRSRSAIDVEVVHRHAGHPLHADDLRAAVVPVDLGGGDDVVVAEGRDAGAEPLLAPCLERRVQLLDW